MNFASSRKPKWIDAPAFSLPRKSGAPLRFLKLSRETFDVQDRGTGVRSTVPTLSYVGVYENETKPFMAVGAVVCIKGNTFLLQHNSSRPISDKIPAETLPQILDYCRVSAIEPE